MVKLYHIINQIKENFKEQGKYITLPHVSIQAMTTIVDYLQRTYLMNLGYDMQVYEPFEIPVEHVLEIMTCSQYLSLTELVELCISKATDNFDSNFSNNYILTFRILGLWRASFDPNHEDFEET